MAISKSFEKKYLEVAKISLFSLQLLGIIGPTAQKVLVSKDYCNFKLIRFVKPALLLSMDLKGVAHNLK